MNINLKDGEKKPYFNLKSDQNKQHQREDTNDQNENLNFKKDKTDKHL